ncbi:ATP-binding protein [Streptomyces sp. YPW6]|uniref:ATP-binding protein n=1 Tax=unclassified Streptomyces TaxID=2593676 RepID=UPI001C0B725B|nr:ATP-binding protein [Streptomyces sp. YPW6]QWQ42763.1 ATP-binding protein [Streptomyces sp. YPW6]
MSELTDEGSRLPDSDPEAAGVRSPGPEGDRVRITGPLKARGARAEVSRLLAGAAGERCLNDALLVVSELISNADRHGGGLREFAAGVEDGHLWLEVADHSDVLPESAAHDPLVPGGFGWSLVRRLSADARIRPRTNQDEPGKTIVVSLRLE